MDKQESKKFGLTYGARRSRRENDTSFTATILSAMRNSIFSSGEFLLVSRDVENCAVI
jgi:hypothetical protein